jgi:phage repressor protein C with HTH and peptisase S24 domain
MKSGRGILLLPFLSECCEGATLSKARALGRGDSLTGIHIFDGDMVVFVPEDIRGDGIYVLRVGDELIVKRVEFDPISRKLRIMSENPRYPDRVESADGQAVEVVGKVYGWVHSHPY